MGKVSGVGVERVDGVEGGKEGMLGEWRHTLTWSEATENFAIKGDVFIYSSSIQREEAVRMLKRERQTAILYIRTNRTYHSEPLSSTIVYTLCVYSLVN